MNSSKKVFLTLGIGLPVLLVAILWSAVLLKQREIPEPKYNFIYTVQKYGPISFEIKNNALYFKFSKKRHTHLKEADIPKIFIYDVNHHTVTEINYQKPNIDFEKLSLGQAVKVFSFEHYNIDTKTTSPDGYQYDYRYSRAPLMLFYNHNSEMRLIKNGKKIKLNIPTEKKHIKIMGWMLPENNDD